LLIGIDHLSSVLTLVPHTHARLKNSTVNMRRGSTFALVGALLLRHGLPANAAGLKVDSRDDILQSASDLAGDIAALYDADGENGPGRLSEDYYYWQSSAFMNTLIDYWHLTNDSTYNDIVVEGIVHQSTDDNFMPANLRPSYLGNDDQCFWGLAAMSAAEAELPDPDEDKPRWLGIAQGVYRAQKARLDAEDEDQCNGGLRWGVDESHHGYGWKNSKHRAPFSVPSKHANTIIALPNACLFDLSARLARHTGNASYADTALELWDWLQGVGLISSNSKQVYLGADTAENCTAQSEIEDSLPASLLINGAAFMFNFVSYPNTSDPWFCTQMSLFKTANTLLHLDGRLKEVAGTCRESHRIGVGNFLPIRRALRARL
jgi:mannan endo-1,6-alpha-mannosidase